MIGFLQVYPSYALVKDGPDAQVRFVPEESGDPFWVVMDRIVTLTPMAGAVVVQIDASGVGGYVRSTAYAPGTVDEIARKCLGFGG